MLNHDITVILLLEGSVDVCGLSKGQEKVSILGHTKITVISCFYQLMPTVYTYLFVCTCLSSPKVPHAVHRPETLHLHHRYHNQVMAAYTAATEENIYSKVLGGEVNSPPPPLQLDEMNHKEKGS